MKKLVFLFGAVIAAGLLSRLDTPAVDVGELEPVALVCLRVESDTVYLRTDTGAWGKGRTLEDAVADLQTRTDGVVFLDTADFLVLSEGWEVCAPQIYEVFRPSCNVCRLEEGMDAEELADYLTVHPPAMTLGELRAEEP